jgi:hypothetical protein
MASPKVEDVLDSLLLIYESALNFCKYAPNTSTEQSRAATYGVS